MAVALELEHAIGWNPRVSSGLLFHPDGKNRVYPLGKNLVITSLTDPCKQTFLEGHAGEITALAMSPSGALLASGEVGRDADIIVWSYHEKKAIYRIQEHSNGIASVSFSHDERFLATLGDKIDRKLFIWDMHTGNVVAKVRVPASRAVSFGGRVKDSIGHPGSVYRLATAVGTQIQLWQFDPATGQLVKDLMREGDHRREYTAFAWSLDFDTLFCGSTTGDITPFKVDSASPGHIITLHSGRVASLKHNMAGEQLELYVGTHNTVTVLQFDGLDWVDIQQRQTVGSVNSISFGPGRQEILAGTTSGHVYRMQAQTLESRQVADSHTGRVTAIDHIPNSDTFATCAADGRVCVWRSRDNSVMVDEKFSSVPLCLAVSPSPEGAVILTGWEDGFIRAVHAKSGGLLWDIPNAHDEGVSCLRVAKNGAFCVSGGVKGDVRVWDLSSHVLISHLKEHCTRVNDVAMYDDNLHCMSCSRDKTILCWDLQKEQRIAAHTQPMGGVNAITLNKDQSRVVSTGQEKRIVVWDLRQQHPVSTQEAPNNSEQLSIATSRDGTLFGTGGADSVFSLFDMKSQQCLTQVAGMGSPVTAASFNLHDSKVLTAGTDGNINIWKVIR